MLISSAANHDLEKNSMSIEQALADLTVAVQANTAALQAINGNTPAEAPVPTKRGKRAAPEQTAADPPASSPAPTNPSTQPPPAPPASPSVTVKQFTDRFVKLAEISADGHAAALQVLKDFKVERASLVLAEKLPEALGLVEARIKELSAPKTPPSASSLI